MRFDLSRLRLLLPQPAARRKGGGLRHNAGAQVAGLLLIAPAIVLLSMVVAGPFVYVVWQSFFEKGGGGATLANYDWFLGPDFWPTLSHGLVIGGVSTVLEVVVAVPLALLLNERIPGRGLLRGLMTLPWAVPTIAVATAFLWLADPFYGLFDQIGLETGVLKQPISVLGDPNYAIWAVTVATAWKGLPLVFIVILSSLQALQAQYLEAAKVDGAWRLAQFRYVVLPHLGSAIALAAVLSGIYNFALFDIAYLLTGGGPAGLTTTWPLVLYNQEFAAFDSGRASAVGVAIFLAGVLALVVVLGLDALRRRRYT